MKTWKIVGITGLLLSGLLFSGTAEARRFDHDSYNRGCQNQRNYSNHGYHHQPRWADARDRGRHYGWERGRHRGWERGRHQGWERGRHRGWDRGNHFSWGQRNHRMAAYNSHRW